MEKKEYHEINQYRDTLFPVEIYHVSEKGMFPFGRGLRDFHWHDELQFTLAVRGSCTLQVDAEQYLLNEGEAAFVNSSMIHAVVSLSPGGHYASLNFPYKLLSFFPGSRMEKESVLPYVTGNCKPVVILRPEIERYKTALNALLEINAIWDSAPDVQGEYLMATKIVTLWSILLPDLSDESGSNLSVDLVHRQRLQRMLSLIYEQYAEDISLTDIAGTANISIGECCRIFREHLQVTPYQFLTEYRVRKSVELLSGELSITEVARYCGYNQASNYIAKFKSIMGCTPAQFRKQVTA